MVIAGNIPSGGSCKPYQKIGRTCHVQFVVDVTGSMVNHNRIETVNDMLKDFFAAMFSDCKIRNAIRIGFICVAYDVVMHTGFSSYGDFCEGIMKNEVYTTAYPKKINDKDYNVNMTEDTVKDQTGKQYTYYFPRFNVINKIYDYDGTHISKGVELAIKKIHEAVEKDSDLGYYPSHLILISDGNADSHSMEITDHDRSAAKLLHEYRDIDLSQRKVIIPTVVGIGKEENLNMDVLRVYKKKERDYVNLPDGADKNALNRIRQIIRDTVINSLSGGRI